MNNRGYFLVGTAQDEPDIEVLITEHIFRVNLLGLLRLLREEYLGVLLLMLVLRRDRRHLIDHNRVLHGHLPTLIHHAS